MVSLVTLFLAFYSSKVDISHYKSFIAAFPSQKVLCIKLSEKLLFKKIWFAIRRKTINPNIQCKSSYFAPDYIEFSLGIIPLLVSVKNAHHRPINGLLDGLEKQPCEPRQSNRRCQRQYLHIQTSMATYRIHLTIFYSVPSNCSFYKYNSTNLILQSRQPCEITAVCVVIIFRSKDRILQL